MIKPMMIMLSFSMALNAFCQQQATVMSYNLLNFPTGNIAGREDTLRKIVNEVQPDIFLIQELKTDAGLQQILNHSFADLDPTYKASTFLTQQSNPGAVSKLQQAMVYNDDMFGLASQGYLMTSTRDINKYKLFYRQPSLASGADTIFLYVFVTHLKSSQGADNVAARLEMVQSFTSHLATLPSNSSVLIAGDFNLYTSTEPAYQELLDNTNAIVLKDPINAPGNWNSSSFQPKSILTQSTRATTIFNDGAGGGLDDRFDFILLSSDMFRSWNTIVYEEGSYHALGNTGNCYNQNITDCDGGAYSDELLSSLYYMSDHLPIILQLNMGVGNVGVSNSVRDELNAFCSDDCLNLTWNGSENVAISLMDMMGREVIHESRHCSRGQNQFYMPKLQTQHGIFILRIESSHQQLITKMFLQ